MSMSKTTKNSLRQRISIRNLDAERQVIMSKIKDEYENFCNFKASKAVQRNIVLVGRTRTGKSTIKSMLINPMVVAEAQSLISLTKDPTFETFHITVPQDVSTSESSEADVSTNESSEADVSTSVSSEVDVSTNESSEVDVSTSESSEAVVSTGESSQNEMSTNKICHNLVLNVIDTPGLFERGTEKMDIRDNQIIMKAIDMCINNEITKFHVICFCVALTAGINQEDIQALKLLFDSIGEEISSNACLIITHCESKTEEQRKALVKQLAEEKEFSSIAPLFQKGIFFSGVLNLDDYKRAGENLLEQYCTVDDYRTSLIKMFGEATEAFPLIETLISNSQRANKREAGLQLKFDELEINFQHTQKELANCRITLRETEKKVEETQDTLVKTEADLKHTQIQVEGTNAELKAKETELEEMKSIDTSNKNIIAELQEKCAIDELLKQDLKAKAEAEEKQRREAEVKRLYEAEARRQAEERQVAEAERRRCEQAEAHERYRKQVEAQQEEARQRIEAERQREIAQRRLSEEQSRGKCSIS